MLNNSQLFVSLILLQALIIGNLGLSTLFYGLNEPRFWTISLDILLSFFLIHMFINISHKNDVIHTQRAQLESMNELAKTIKSQRHDFLNHLTALYGLLQMGKFSEARQYACEMCNEARDVGQLANLKQPEVAALLQRKKAQSLHQGIVLNLDLKTDLTELNQIRSYDLNRILGNLIDNSLEALLGKDGHKEITVTIADERNNYIIAVSDNGPGLEPETSKKIFQPGFSTKGKSRGLGLAIVKEIVCAVKGHIQVTENPVTFKITIPKKQG